MKYVLTHLASGHTQVFNSDVEAMKALYMDDGNTFWLEEDEKEAGKYHVWFKGNNRSAIKSYSVYGISEDDAENNMLLSAFNDMLYNENEWSIETQEYSVKNLLRVALCDGWTGEDLKIALKELEVDDFIISIIQILYRRKT